MLSFITYKDAPEELEIIFDSDGADDLIQYLQGVKEQKDHMHLVIDTELNPYPIMNEKKEEVFYAKYVRIEYAEKKEWDIKDK